jgi:ankyrin repeat protein
MDTLPLPPRPHLDQYRKRAKELVAAAASGDDARVRAWATDWLEALARSLGVESTGPYKDAVDRAVSLLANRVSETVASARSRGGRFGLSDAQFLIASAHGFANWADFARQLDHPFAGDSRGREFEAAVDAVVVGDLATLETLVRTHPRIVHEHSARTHRATLLHYVAANGVEDYRQRTPPNAVAVARLLLDAGAKVDALADTYGRDHYQTTMNLLVSSAHPHIAGLQAALVDVLCDYGAAVNGLSDDETPLLTALDFGYWRAAEALVRRGARVDNVATAAAMGREDLVRRFVLDRATLAPGVPRIAPPWRDLPSEAAAHIELALVWACKFRQANVAAHLNQLGVNPAASDGYRMTALHHAAANGMLDTMDLLIARGAPLEAENIWGGTVLDSTIYFATQDAVRGVAYLPVIDKLLKAGANALAVEVPTGVAEIDRLLAGY